MSTFTESKLGSLIDTIIDYRGKTPKKLGGDWSTSGIPALSAKNIKKGKIVNPESIRYVDEILYKRWMKEEVEKGDILMTSEAPLGEIYYVKSDEKVLLSQRLFSIRTKAKELNSRFLYYYFNSKFGRHELLSRATGTTVGGIRQTALVKVLVRFPEDPKVQHEIAETLGAYDDLIENNEKRIKTLEQMAELLYIEWFVKFKFPGYEKVEFVDSGTSFGKIPEGWKIGKVSDIANVVSGFPFKGSTYQVSGKYKIVTIKNVHDGQFVLNFDSFINELPAKLPKSCILDAGDILLSLTGNVGRICVVYGKDHVLNQRVAKLQPTVVTNREFIYSLFRQERFQQKLEAMSNGAAQQNLSPIQVKDINIIIPGSEIMNEFSQICSRYFDMALLLQENNQTLSNTRDLLIPQLVTGKRELKNI